MDGTNRRLCLIVFSNPDSYPPLVNSVRMFTQYGFQVDVFSIDKNPSQKKVWYPPAVPVYRINMPKVTTWQDYVQFVIRMLGYGRPDVRVFIGHQVQGFLPALILARRYHRPLVYHCHDFFDRNRQVSFSVRILSAFEQRFARTSDIVIVPDAERAAVVAQVLRLSRPPLVVANAPLNTSLATGDTLHQALAAQGKQFEQIVFRQGRIGKGHAPEETIRSIPYWQSNTWGFVLMGPGEPTYLEHLTRVAHSLGVERQFAILPPVIYDEVQHFTPGASIGHGLYKPVHINHTYISTASNKIMEYMAAGLPLLVSDRPGLRQMIETYHCGMVADETDPASIAAAINTLLNNPHQAQAMGDAARRAFEAEFCYERQFAPMGEAFQRLIVA